jgi:hypothetical protein
MRSWPCSGGAAWGRTGRRQSPTACGETQDDCFCSALASWSRLFRTRRTVRCCAPARAVPAGLARPVVELRRHGVGIGGLGSSRSAWLYLRVGLELFEQPLHLTVILHEQVHNIAGHHLRESVTSNLDE